MTHLLASSGAEMPPFFILLSIVFIGVMGLALILAKFRQSMLFGYFACGVILANTGLLADLPDAKHSIDALAEVGVVLLMFALGVEFSLDELKNLRRQALLGGSIQMGLCSLAFGTGIHYLFDCPWHISLIVGAIIGLSSTAVFMKSFQEMGLHGTSSARMALGIALFQDTIAVLLIAIMPQVAREHIDPINAAWNMGLALSKGIIFLLAAWAIGKYALPPLMQSVAKTKSRELFTLTVFATCSGIAVIAGLLELSVALGAFIAGLVVSSSYYSHRVLSEVLPFKDLFLMLFFVSAGLLIDVPALWNNMGSISLILLVVLTFKFVVAWIASSACRLPAKMGFITAISMSNVGEFSLVCVTFLSKLFPLPGYLENNIYAIAAVSMGLTPPMMRLAVRLSPRLGKLPIFKRSARMDTASLTSHLTQVQDHAIICGYGPVGRKLHAELRTYGIPCIIVDLNAESVKSLLNSGNVAILGDITHEITMELSGVSRAKLIAFTFPDTAPALAAHHQIWGLNPSITIMARAKFHNEVVQLSNHNITHVIHDESETGAAIIRVARQVFDII